MSKRVKGPDGIVRIFPDDATDEEIGAALEQSAAPAKREPTIGANLHPEAKISAGRHSEYFGGLPPAPDIDARRDSNMLDIGGIGIAPDEALMGVQAGRAILAPGLKLAGRAAAAAGQVLPVVKYEAAKHALEAMHVPPGVAAVIAMGIAGYKKGAKPPVAEPTTMPAGARPAAAAPRPEPDVAPAVQSAPPAAAPVKPAPFNPNTALKDAREAFVARGEAPRPAEVSNVAEHLRRGKTPDEALDIVLSKRSATAPAKPAAPAKPSFTAEEVAFGQRLMARGKTQQQAIDAILAQRAFKQMPGVLSDADARAALDARNASGKIKSPSAQTARERRR